MKYAWAGGCAPAAGEPGHGQVRLVLQGLKTLGENSLYLPAYLRKNAYRVAGWITAQVMMETDRLKQEAVWIHFPRELAMHFFRTKPYNDLRKETRVFSQTLTSKIQVDDVMCTHQTFLLKAHSGLPDCLVAFHGIMCVERLPHPELYVAKQELEVPFRPLHVHSQRGYHAANSDKIWQARVFDDGLTRGDLVGHNDFLKQAKRSTVDSDLRRLCAPEPKAMPRIGCNTVVNQHGLNVISVRKLGRHMCVDKPRHHDKIWAAPVLKDIVGNLEHRTLHHTSISRMETRGRLGCTILYVRGISVARHHDYHHHRCQHQHQLTNGREDLAIVIAI